MRCCLWLPRYGTTAFASVLEEDFFGWMSPTGQVLGCTYQSIFPPVYEGRRLFFAFPLARVYI
jgi:hypothetical protein